MAGTKPDRQADETTTLRAAMVRNQLAARGVDDPRVLAAMGRVPRERFVPEDLRGVAYDDRALPTADGQTISQPYIVAYMTERLDLRPEHRVLEVGTGTGYQTAVLAELCRQVYTIERLESLSVEARRRLEELGIHNVSFLVADGTLGWPEHAPYERIMVTAAAPAVPQPLLAQLTEGGKIVLPVGPEHDQHLVLVEQRAGRTVETPLIAVRFVKLIGHAGWQG